MQPRLDQSANPAAYRAMMQLGQYVQDCGLNPTLLELIKIRASQINGCAFCIDMHTKDARLHGETEQRIYALNGWRETPFFTPEERAVLAFTEAVTLIATNHVSDALYEEVGQYFSAEQIANLLLAIVTINGWNRIAITSRVVPGTYEPPTSDQRSSELLAVK
jgi:AhpD family alkylhydroperoxidase